MFSDTFHTIFTLYPHSEILYKKVTCNKYNYSPIETEK